MKRVVDAVGREYLFTAQEVKAAEKRCSVWLKPKRCRNTKCDEVFVPFKRTDIRATKKGKAPAYCSDKCRNRYNSRKSMRKLRYRRKMELLFE